MDRRSIFGLLALIAILMGLLSWAVLGGGDCTISFGFAGDAMPTRHEVTQAINGLCPDAATRSMCICQHDRAG